MRRCVTSNGISGAAQYGFHHRAGRTFAVGPSNSDYRECRRKIETDPHLLYALQPHVDGFGMKAFQMG
jgi:hypothetical protein